MIASASCVIKATIKIKEKTINEITDAIKRINILLGVFNLVEWGNAACGWWSHITHGSMAGILKKWQKEDIQKAVNSIISLPPEIRSKVEAALFWIREPCRSCMETDRDNSLRIYSAYWNAFECLAEAINILFPIPKLSKKDKQDFINKLIIKKGGKLTPSDINGCYKKVVNPGFVEEAKHALFVCFKNNASYYINECFKLPEKRNRLYQIRNDINHGNIDAENPEEIIRVGAHLKRLWMILWNIFGRLIPFEMPLDSKIPKTD